MRVVEGVKYGNRQLRFTPRAVSRRFLPESIGAAQVQEMITSDVCIGRNEPKRLKVRKPLT